MIFDFEQANEMMQKEINITPESTFEDIDNISINSFEDAKKALDLALYLRLSDKKHALDKKMSLAPINEARQQINDRYKATIEGIHISISKIIEKLDIWSKSVDQFDGLKTESGSLYFKKNLSFEVAEIAKVPFEFIKIDEEAVLKAIKSGIEIPGIITLETKETHIRLSAQE